MPYTHGYHESVLRSHRWRTAQNSADHLLPELSPGLSLLDVGSGAGTITADLAQLVAPGRVTALEANERSLELTRSTLTERGIEADLVVGDAHRLDFPDDSFDVVHAHQVLQHLADPVQALREMARVAKPGGIVAVRESDYGGFTWYPSDPRLDEWLELYCRIARSNGGEPDAGRHLLAWAHAAGLTGAVASAAVWCFADDVDRDWWGTTSGERVSASLGDQARASGVTDADLERITQGWRDWTVNPDAWFAILHGQLLIRLPAQPSEDASV